MINQYRNATVLQKYGTVPRHPDSQNVGVTRLSTHSTSPSTLHCQVAQVLSHFSLGRRYIDYTSCTASPFSVFLVDRVSVHSQPGAANHRGKFGAWLLKLAPQRAWWKGFHHTGALLRRLAPRPVYFLLPGAVAKAGSDDGVVCSDVVISFRMTAIFAELKPQRVLFGRLGPLSGPAHGAERGDVCWAPEFKRRQKAPNSRCQGRGRGTQGRGRRRHKRCVRPS